MSSIAGRFLSRDPIGYEGSNWNNYEFLGGSVFDYVDYDGLDKNPIAKPPVKIPVTPRVLPVAGGCAAADGPIPIGDAIALGLIICAVIHDTCTGTQVYVDPEQPGPPEPPEDLNPPKKKTDCKTDYPGWEDCSRYPYNTANATLRANFRGGSSLRNHKPAKACGAGGGDHWNVHGPRGFGFLGSILCCFCCEDTSKGPITKKKCKAQ